MYRQLKVVKANDNYALSMIMIEGHSTTAPSKNNSRFSFQINQLRAMAGLCPPYIARLFAFRKRARTHIFACTDRIKPAGF